MYKIGENEMVLCPYNRCHVVSKLRIQKHIIKCKSRYPEVNLITCFYNYTHKLRPEDALKHYEVCTQKIRMEGARYCESNKHASSRSTELNDEYNFNSENNERASLSGFHKTDSVKSNDTQSVKYKTIESQNQSLNLINKNDDYDDEDLKPLNLPKTVSKAFIGVKQETEKSSDTEPALQPALPQSRSGRGTTFFISPPRPPRTTDHLLPDVSDMNREIPKKIKSKHRFFLNNVPNTGNCCNSSVTSSFFDDGTTLKSDDFTFDDDDDDDDGFIFKNFDKYVRV